MQTRGTCVHTRGAFGSLGDSRRRWRRTGARFYRSGARVQQAITVSGALGQMHDQKKFTFFFCHRRPGPSPSVD
jgi:hypothetical protein